MLMKVLRRSIWPAFIVALLLPPWASAQIDVEVSVNVAPPELPVYEQPPIPGDGYVWTPGYWAWGDDDQDYYWVPGTWVQAPQPEYLWTPGYWAFAGALYLWHPGYWGPHVGFYGGVNYGYGYGGNGYEGGYWQGGRLYYNRSVNNISNVNITNVYNKTVINNVTVNRVSYNGGAGVRAAPTENQRAASRERHLEPTQLQRQHIEMAHHDQSLRASQNQGRPPIAATPRPAAFQGPSVMPARQTGNYNVSRPNSPPQMQTQRDNSVQRENQAQRENQVRRDNSERAPAVSRPIQQQPQSQPRAEAPRYPQQPPSRPENPQRNEAPRPQPQPEPRPAQPEQRREAPAEQRRPPEAQRPNAPPPQVRPNEPPPHAERPGEHEHH